MRSDDFKFQSPMRRMLKLYVRERRVCGYALTSKAGLRELDRFFLAEPKRSETLGRDAYTRFIAHRAGEAASTQEHRASTWRQFVLFCHRRGLACYVPGKHDVPIHREEYRPYIYSRAEVAALFDAIERLPNGQRSPRRIPNFRVLYRLLYGTGLRLGEALRLKIGDLNRDTNVLTVRQGKNQKDRFIPLSAGLADVVARHIDRYPGPTDTPLFLSPFRRHEIDPETVEYTFRIRLLPLAGLPKRSKRIGPRVHDLRHTFAVHRLENWFKAGKDIEAKLPYLSAYMGHTHVRDTYYYLRITASFFPEITRRFRSRVGEIIPSGARL